MKQIKLNGGIGQSYYRKHNLCARSKWQECIGVILLWVFIGMAILATVDKLNTKKTKDSLVCNFITNCFSGRA